MNKILFLTFKNKSVGLGNYKRTIHFKNIVKNEFKTKIYSIEKIKYLEDFQSICFKKIFKFKPSILIIDINNKLYNKKIKKNIKKLTNTFFTIGIDTHFKNLMYFSYNWIASLDIDRKKVNKRKKFNFFYGPKSIIIDKNNITYQKKKNSILILSGSTDNSLFLKELYKSIEKIQKIKYYIVVIIGPFAKKINLSKKNSFHKWKIIYSPKNIIKYLKKTEITVVRYGVSFFEALNYDCKTIVYTTDTDDEKPNINFIKKNKISEYIEHPLDIESILNKKNFKKKIFFMNNHNKFLIKKIYSILKTNESKKT